MDRDRDSKPRSGVAPSAGNEAIDRNRKACSWDCSSRQRSIFHARSSRKVHPSTFPSFFFFPECGPSFGCMRHRIKKKKRKSAAVWSWFLGFFEFSYHPNEFRNFVWDSFFFIPYTPHIICISQNYQTRWCRILSMVGYSWLQIGTKIWSFFHPSLDEQENWLDVHGKGAISDPNDIEPYSKVPHKGERWLKALWLKVTGRSWLYSLMNKLNPNTREWTKVRNGASWVAEFCLPMLNDSSNYTLLFNPLALTTEQKAF